MSGHGRQRRRPARPGRVGVVRWRTLLLFERRLLRRGGREAGSRAGDRKLRSRGVRGPRWRMGRGSSSPATIGGRTRTAPSPTPRSRAWSTPLDATRGVYVLDTPKFASRYRDQLAAALEDAQTWMSESGGKDLGLDKCRLLRPALGLIYGGRFDDGLVLHPRSLSRLRSRAVRARHGRESPPEPVMDSALASWSLVLL